MTEEYELRVCDLNAIESRVIGWLSGCARLNKVFADGLDPYKDFGKEMYGKPYDQITKKERNDSKPGSLGCLGAFTQVLTPRGFVRIVNLQADDLIHDGEGWQAHGGVIAQGLKEVFDLGGLQITKDHLVLTPEGWQEAWHVHQNAQSVLRATDLANDLLKATFAKSARAGGFVKVPTYDVSNAGPLNRFVVLTDRGPLVVHNCGFRLGGGALDPVTGKRTGLWGYAEKMGVDLTQEQSEQNVKVFRAIYPEIPVLWYDFESAAAKCMRTNQPVNVGPFLRFERRAPYLMLRLPSGRFIYYFQPKMVELWFAKHPTKGHIKNLGQDAARAERAKEKGWKVWSKVNLSYMGKPQNKPGWVRLPTHGGKLTENAVQAVARDILKEGMLRADEDGFNIVGHVYDEIITCHTKTDTYHTVKRLADLMTQPIDWAPGLLLGAAGWSGSFYKKD